MDRALLVMLMKRCFISCSTEEEEALLTEFNSSLRHLESLNDVNTEGFEPCYALDEGELCLDPVDCCLEREAFLKNVLSIDGFVYLPPPTD